MKSVNIDEENRKEDDASQDAEVSHEFFLMIERFKKDRQIPYWHKKTWQVLSGKTNVKSYLFRC